MVERMKRREAERTRVKRWKGRVKEEIEEIKVGKNREME